MDLPNSFLQEMKQLLGSDFEKYIRSFDDSRIFGLRINSGKVSEQKTNELLPEHAEKIPWIKNGFYYGETDKPSKSPYYYAGLYYLQEPSAMTPASILPVSPGETVLDLCAAPGGKSTELGVKLQGKGMLFANDLSNSRAKALLKNLELFAIPNICVTSESPKKLADQLPEYFDKILVDAPCSGEGMFRKEESMIKSWTEKGPDFYAPIQKEILADAFRMLKPGGMLLYSTCTFSKTENEDVICELLEQHPEMELVLIPRWEGASEGIGLPGTIRLFPFQIKGEGHFIALLKKRTEGSYAAAIKNNIKSWKPTPELIEFLSSFPYSFDLSRLVLINDQIYYLPEYYPSGCKFRYLRTGLLVGTVQRNRFEPSQAFAMVLAPVQCKNYLSLTKDDPNVIRYLKGETIQLEESSTLTDGWCLVGIDQYPLGFAKKQGCRLKNKYYPGWRWQ